MTRKTKLPILKERTRALDEIKALQSNWQVVFHVPSWFHVPCFKLLFYILKMTLLFIFFRRFLAFFWIPLDIIYSLVRTRLLPRPVSKPPRMKKLNTCFHHRHHPTTDSPASTVAFWTHSSICGVYRDRQVDTSRATLNWHRHGLEYIPNATYLLYRFSLDPYLAESTMYSNLPFRFILPPAHSQTVLVNSLG
jgi:hypothetical protein